MSMSEHMQPVHHGGERDIQSKWEVPVGVAHPQNYYMREELEGVAHLNST